MKIASVLQEIVYASVEQAKLKSRFRDVPKNYPANTILMLPCTVTVQVDRRFTINVTQIPMSPSFEATTHKLQGATCNSILTYLFNEPERQATSLMYWLPA